MADIVLTNYVNINYGKPVTIDLNGHDLGRGLSDPPADCGDGHVVGVRAGSVVTIETTEIGMSVYA